jgi:hypothetical protein
MRKPVIVEVNGGVVTNVWNCKNWQVLDWDNLLGDGADTKEQWSTLSEQVQKIVQHAYPEDFARIMDRIQEGS